MFKFHSLVLAGAIALGVGSAQAALIDRGGGLIYDSVQNLTWLQNARYCNLSDDPACISSGLAPNGTGTWSQAKAFVEALDYRGYTDWRLPRSLQPDMNCTLPAGGLGVSVGLNCSGSEMGHLYYVSGIRGGVGKVQPENGPFFRFASDAAPFVNVVLGVFGISQGGEPPVFERAFYWTETPGPTENVMAFSFSDGLQGIALKQLRGQTWAVRDGDVAQIPLPPTGALFLLGLVCLGLRGRWRAP